MPNYCENSLTIYASDETLEKIRNFVRSDENEFDFNNVIPMPSHIYNDSLGTKEWKLYGMNNWYDWSNQYWGTKWNSVDACFSDNNFYFETAWTPASPVVAELARLFPKAEFWFQYQEFGVGFCGVEVYQEGRLVYEMQGDIVQNWTLEDPDYCDEDELEDCLIEDELFPMQDEGLYVSLDCDWLKSRLGKKNIHIREYKHGKIYTLIDGTYFDFRPCDKKLAYWNEDTDYLLYDEEPSQECA